jgi:hypothetical protein
MSKDIVRGQKSPNPAARKWGLGRSDYFAFLSFTPGSPSLVNSTPAASRASSIASLMPAEGSLRPYSNALMELVLTPDAPANLSCDQPSATRAGLRLHGRNAHFMLLSLAPGSP